MTKAFSETFFTVQEAKDMASPALEIAQKTKDVGLQLWAALLIAGNWLVIAADSLDCCLRLTADVW